MHEKIFYIIFLIFFFFTRKSKADIIYADIQTNGTTGACLFCSVTNPGDAVDADHANYSTERQPVATLGATVYQNLHFSLAGPSGVTIVIVVENDNLGILDATILGGLDLKLKNGSTVVDTRNSSNATLNLLSGSTTRYTISFTACCNFDEVQVILNSGIAGALTKLRIYFAYYVVVPLPVELIRFEGKADLNCVKINWQTASEINNNFFTLEKSADGKNFAAICKVNGAGSSANLLSYSVSDNKALSGNNYYRLKQTDFNGETKYSSIINIYYHINGNFSLTNLFFGDELRFNLIADPGTKFSVTISNLQGEIIYFAEYKIKQENEKISIDAASFKKGIYILTPGNFSKTRRYKIFRN